MIMSNELSASSRKRRSLSIASRSARPRRRCSAMCATPSTGKAMQSARMTRVITIAAKFSWSKGADTSPAALPDGAAMTSDTVFWIASMSKAITSTAAMQLVERGKLSLDRPIAEILPELASPQVLDGFDAAGEPRLRPAKRRITLRHLITHTAGFTYEIWNPEMGRYMEACGVPGIITCQNAALN